jgi:hypothetical protein
MQRRDLFRILGGAAATSVLGPLSPEQRLDWGRRLHASIASGAPALTALSPAQAVLVDELAELILPRTETPGARDVGVVQFIDRILAFWDTAAERDRFLEGLTAIERRAQSAGAVRFAELDSGGKITLLTALDGSGADAGTAEAAWHRLKSMTVYGYFTSRQVQQDVLKTVVVPGRFDGCLPVGGPP